MAAEGDAAAPEVFLPALRGGLHAHVSLDHLEEAVARVELRGLGAQVLVDRFVRRPKVVHVRLALRGPARCKEGVRGGSSRD